MLNRIRALSAAALIAVAAGCAPEPTPSAPAPAAGDASAYLLDAEPAGAKGVVDARADAKDGEEVVVVGRIGGDVNPWVDGRAAFSIVDLSAQACSDIPGDNCPTPWDYCCEADLPQKRLLVKVVDPQGELLRQGAKEAFGLKELQTVVVRGKAQRDKEGNLTVLADGLYVRQ
ncbi:MAG TPA: hypothetical protein VIL46_00270 [Gemmataceae bacterium]